MPSNRILTASAALFLIAALSGCSTPAAETPTAETPVAEAPAADSPASTSSPAAPADTDAPSVTAEEITAAFTAAGLTVTDPRDNTDKGWCAAEMYDCVQYYTTEEAAIVTFASTEKATEVHDMLAGKELASTWAFSSGPAALYFNGRDTTPESQALYSAELEKLLAAR